MKQEPKDLAIPAMLPVKKSSNVAHVGYDEATGTLHVVYKTGGHYAYAGVPKELHDAMWKAESVGSFINSNITSNSIKPAFKHTKIK